MTTFKPDSPHRAAPLHRDLRVLARAASQAARRTRGRAPGRHRARGPARLVPRLPVRRRRPDRHAVEGRRRGLARDDPDDARIHGLLPARVRALPAPPAGHDAVGPDAPAARAHAPDRRRARAAADAVHRRHRRRPRRRLPVVVGRPAADARHERTWRAESRTAARRRARTASYGWWGGGFFGGDGGGGGGDGGGGGGCGGGGCGGGG